MAVLRQFASDGTGRSVAIHELPPSGLVIGRGDSVGIFVDEPSVSRTHAQLVQHEAGWMVVGLSHANPVLVGGHPVASQLLSDGGRFKLGTVEFQLLEIDPRAQATIIGGRSRQTPPPPPLPVAPPSAHAATASASPPPIPPPMASPPPPAAVAPNRSAAPPPRIRELGAHERPGPPRPGFFARNGAEILAAVAVVGAGAGGFWWWLQRADGEVEAPQATPSRATAKTVSGEPNAEPEPPLEDPPATEESASGESLAPFAEVRVTKDGASFRGEGFSLSADGGAFSEGTILKIRTRRDVAPPDGIRALGPPVEVNAGGMQPSRDVVLRFPFDGKGLPSGKEPVVFSRAGDKLRAYPSYYDREKGEIVARVHHFTVVHPAVVVAVGALVPVFIDAVQGAVTALSGEWQSLYAGEYITRAGIKVRYDPKGFGTFKGHPKYVLDTGAAFDEALTTFGSRKEFSDVHIRVDQMPTIVIVDRVENKPTGKVADISWDSGVMGDTAPNLSTIAIQAGLGPRLLRQTALHESMHVWQVLSVGWSLAGGIGWWKEASAEWAGWVAHPAVTRESNVGQFPGTEHVSKGFHGSVEMNERYNLGDFTVYLDRLCPGIIMDSWSSTGFVAMGQSWYEGLEPLLQRRCKLEFRTVLGDYLILHSTKTGTPRGPGSGLPLPTNFPSSKYVRLRKTLSAVSAHNEAFRIAATDGNYKMIARERTWGGERHHLLYGLMPNPAGSAFLPSTRLGKDARAVRIVRPNFGGARAKPPGTANVVYVLKANPRAESVRENFELYLLGPPKALAGSVVEGKGKPKISLRWTRPALALGTKPDDNGALSKIRIYQSTASGSRKVGEVDATTTTFEGELDLHWANDRATVFARAVDKYGSESHDSDKVQLRRKSKPEPKPKPKPKPRVRPKPRPAPVDKCARCPMSGPQCSLENTKTRCWNLGCCE